MFKICPSWALRAVNLCVLTAHVIRLVIVPCSKQLGCELLLAGVYSSIRHCERMTSDTSGSAAALLQSHNLQHKSCVLVCWATKCHGNLISLSQAVTLELPSLSLCRYYNVFFFHLIVIKSKYISQYVLCAVIHWAYTACIVFGLQPTLCNTSCLKWPQQEIAIPISPCSSVCIVALN